MTVADIAWGVAACILLLILSVVALALAARSQKGRRTKLTAVMRFCDDLAWANSDTLLMQVDGTQLLYHHIIDGSGYGPESGPEPGIEVIEMKWYSLYYSDGERFDVEIGLGPRANVVYWR